MCSARVAREDMSLRFAHLFARHRIVEIGEVLFAEASAVHRYRVEETLSYGIDVEPAYPLIKRRFRSAVRVAVRNGDATTPVEAIPTGAKNCASFTRVTERVAR